MEKMLKTQSEKHDFLMAEVSVLREQVWGLKMEIFAHAQCSDRQITHELQKMAQGILGEQVYHQGCSTSTGSVSALPIISDSILAAQESTGEHLINDLWFDSFIGT